MTYPKDQNGRYLIPSRGDEPRVEADCSYGDGWNVPTRVWDYISERRAAAHTRAGTASLRRVACGCGTSNQVAGRAAR